MSNHGLWTPPRSPRSSSPASNASGTPSPSLSQRSSAYFSADPSPIPAPPRRDSRVENPGRRVAQIIKLRPECVPQYKECHAKVWPEVLKQIRECGIRDYGIYHDPASNMLFATFRYVGYGFADDMERMRENPRVREWWRLTDGMQESLVEGATGSAEGAWWTEVESVFYTA